MGGNPFTPSGATNPGGQSWATSSTYIAVTGMVADTSTYPGSTVTSNKLNVQGSKTNATIAASIPFGSSFGGATHTIRLVDQSGTVIGSPGSAVGGISGTCTVTASGVDLSAITSVGVEMAASGAGSGNTAATGTLTIT
ncbi:hypothetical protein ACQPXH_19285 [Nocardia sp. CA-135953]|uniref:hypothetical protein n=1 Tax=Nocardia sp. CA-135953 TaxID=3239978 RepID=UPI003D973AC0